MNYLAFTFLSLLVFFIPCESVVMISGVGTISRMVGLLSFATAVMALLSVQKIRRLHAAHWILYMFFIWSLLTCLWSINLEQSLGRCWTYGQLMVMVWMLWQWTPDVASISKLFVAYIAGAYVSILSTYYNFLSHKEVVWQRFAATGFDPNELGLILALGIPISWYMSLGTRNYCLNILLRVYVVAAIYAIVLTASRMAVIVTIVALLFILCTFSRLSIRPKFFLLMIFLIFAPIAASKIPATSLARISTIGIEVASGTLNNRMIIWGAGFEALSNNLLLGSGVGTFSTAVKPILKEEAVAHNIYLTILVEQGVIGFVLFSFFLLYIIKTIFVMPKLERWLWMTIIAVWGVGVFTLSWDARKTTWLVLVLCISHGQLHGVKAKNDAFLKEDILNV